MDNLIRQSTFVRFGNRFCQLMALVIVAVSPALLAKGEGAADFPPGVFSDGGHYQMSDFAGKAVVLFFFESECPKCKGLIPSRNEVVAKFKDKPVKFIAVGPHNSLQGVKAYVMETKLAMPVFADNLNIMETMYGQNISLKNIYQFRAINGKGHAVPVEFTEASINDAIKGVEWKYKNKGYNPQLNGIIEMLEWNQFDPAMKQLRPLRKSGSKSLAESAEKLYQQVKAETTDWIKDADKEVEKNPSKAYDTYARVASMLAGDDLPKEVTEGLKTLKANAQVQSEMAARVSFAQLYSAIPKAQLKQREQVAQFCQSIVDKHPGTPTAEKAKAIADAIAKAPQ